MLTFADIPRYVQGQWIITDDDLQYEDTDGQSLAVEESIWPDSPSEVVEQVTAEDLNLLTTPEPYNVKDQGWLLIGHLQSRLLCLQHNHQKHFLKNLFF